MGVPRWVLSSGFLSSLGSFGCVDTLHQDRLGRLAPASEQGQRFPDQCPVLLLYLGLPSSGLGSVSRGETSAVSRCCQCASLLLSAPPSARTAMHEGLGTAPSPRLACREKGVRRLFLQVSGFPVEILGLLLYFPVLSRSVSAHVLSWEAERARFPAHIQAPSHFSQGRAPQDSPSPGQVETSIRSHIHRPHLLRGPGVGVHLFNPHLAGTA